MYLVIDTIDAKNRQEHQIPKEVYTKLSPRQIAALAYTETVLNIPFCGQTKSDIHQYLYLYLETAKAVVKNSYYTDSKIVEYPGADTEDFNYDTESTLKKDLIRKNIPYANSDATLMNLLYRQLKQSHPNATITTDTRVITTTEWLNNQLVETVYTLQDAYHIAKPYK